MYEEMANSQPKLQRGMVWCKTCKRAQKVDSGACLSAGWPECCGHTMTIDHPSEWPETTGESEP